MYNYKKCENFKFVLLYVVMRKSALKALDL